MSGAAADYVRFVALGDSASCGVGDPTPEGWRGWAQILADAIGEEHHVSFCKLAVPGAVVDDVRRQQLDDALDHRPVVASLIVGVNDVLRSSWDPEQVRADLLHCARELARSGALIVTVRFHDHTRVLGIPRPLANPLRRRIDALNAIYDEVHEEYGTLQVDLGAEPAVYDRDFWAFDRLHPSEQGHRWLARRIGELLGAEGLTFPLPSLACTGTRETLREHAHTLVAEVAPWLGRRAGDVARSAGRGAARRLFSGTAGAPVLQ
ncbi:SGNH/GDSL hydrolase family protein [Nocardioides humilatus]|uniref:SGNH/GDSL hydrolase family protein n=1 Tax=Nocardioides humilatus TaxID=2607660 RepID=A0A5B1LQ74_9ACTN|nr:SGNH/GDSL hydrolase family protein [Nocardioides humilatus]KAA1421839.1 SGNH/GDSL hydrolase family protein [Nocardioides humilatus]